MSLSSKELDEEGFLIDPQRWNPNIAELIARSEGIVMEDLEWGIIHSLRNFYAKTDIVPLSRAFIKLVREDVDSSIGNSFDLMKIFGQSPAKTAAKIAGLPKNSICI